jgi:putative peptidoglycan lipid II flippase
MAVLNSLGYFFVPAITPVLFSITVITSIIFFYKSLGIFSMVVGVLSGGLLQILFQLPLYIKEKYDFKFCFYFNNYYFKKIIKNWLPVVITASIFAINSQIAVRFASALEKGSSSALSYAIVFYQFPFGIFSASITTVLFPKMSRLAAENKIDDLLTTVNNGVVNLYSLLLPSSFFLFIMGPEIISIAMQRGSFSAENTYITSLVLKGYALGIFSTGFFNLLQRFYYSVHNYNKPFIFALIVCILDIIFSVILKETILRVSGLAIANAIAFTIGASIMFFDIKRTYKQYSLKTVISGIYKITFSSLLPALLMILSKKYFANLWQNGLNFKLLFYFTFSGIFFCFFVLLLYKIMKVEFIFFFKRRIRL